MLVRLSRAKRLKAGRLVALVYLLCVMAPTLSFALPGSQAASPCLAAAEHVPGMIHVHAVRAASLEHANEHMHEHAMAHPHADATDHAASVQAPVAPAQKPSKGSHPSDGQCCGLMCLSALPANLVEVVTPSVPRASTEIDCYREVADSGTSQRYRPPIA